jgi:hypothetical protein
MAMLQGQTLVKAGWRTLWAAQQQAPRQQRLQRTASGAAVTSRFSSGRSAPKRSASVKRCASRLPRLPG